jgi:hypothetical protein
MIRLFVAVLMTTALAAQTAPTDNQLTQALLTEIRALRQDLQTTAATIQRVQILMYRLQIESTLLNSATQRREQIRNMCSNTDQRRKMMTSQIEQMEAAQRSTLTPPDPKLAEQTGQRIGQLKTNLEMLGIEEQSCQTRQIDAESELRTQQMKVADLQDRFDKLDKVLAGIGGK